MKLIYYVYFVFLWNCLYVNILLHVCTEMTKIKMLNLSMYSKSYTQYSICFVFCSGFVPADLYIWSKVTMMTSSNGNIFRSPVNSLHKDQWRGALLFSLICTRINGWVNNSEAGDLRRHRAHYDVTEMCQWKLLQLRLGELKGSHWATSPGCLFVNVRNGMPERQFSLYNCIEIGNWHPTHKTMTNYKSRIG